MKTSQLAPVASIELDPSSPRRAAVAILLEGVEAVTVELIAILSPEEALEAGEPAPSVAWSDLRESSQDGWALHRVGEHNVYLKITS